VGLTDRDAGVLGGEGGVDRAIELARGVIGDVQQLGLGVGGKRDGEDAQDE
jgi:hypothetical protein